MGQQPNVELSIEDLPRPTLHPDAPGRWSPDRPGELDGPEDVPWGGAYGTPGPDTGYALTLVAGRDLPDVSGIHRADLEVAVAAIAGARASHVGRAPTAVDIDVAVLILGLDADTTTMTVRSLLADDRERLVVGIGHNPGKARELVASIPLDVFAASPVEVEQRAAGGERFIRVG